MALSKSPVEVAVYFLDTGINPEHTETDGIDTKRLLLFSWPACELPFRGQQLSALQAS